MGEQRRGWRDKTILSLQKSQSASVRLVGRWTDYCDCGSSNIQDCQHKNSAGTGAEVGSVIWHIMKNRFDAVVGG